MKATAPRVTIGLTVVTVAAYLLTPAIGGHSTADAIAGFVPARVAGPTGPTVVPIWITPLTATLLHANPLHLGFNLVMLLFCGREDEVALGPGGTVVLYGIGAYAAAAAQYLAFSHSTVPMVGASGAISALVGAYALLYGQRRPSRLPREIARWVHIAWLAAAWIVLQLLLGIASATTGVAVATAAHVGGFAAGLLLARPLLRWRYRRA